MTTKLKSTITEIEKKLELLHINREEILNLTRKIIRDCSIAIKNVHRSNFEDYNNKISEIKTNHEELVAKVDKNLGFFFKYLKTSEQEYTEAIIFYSIIKNESIPSPFDLNVNPIHYLLGLADVIGELRRYALDNMRKSQIKGLDDILEAMDEIYTHLFSLDYPSGVIQDLRHKIDVSRNIIEKTRGEISLAIQMNKLKNCLDK